MMKNRRGWMATPAGSNENIKLEIPRAWEPLDSSKPLQACKGSSFHGMVRMDLINYTTNHIMVKVQKDSWFLTSFYGWPEAIQRDKSWALLNNLKSFVDSPWVYVDDFNAILSSAEKLSRTPTEAYG